MTIELRSIHEYPESDGWEIHWKSQSFETACEIRDSITPERNPLVAATGEPALPFAAISQRFRCTNEFPMHTGVWLARNTPSAPPSGCATRSTKKVSRSPASPNPGTRIFPGL